MPLFNFTNLLFLSFLSFLINIFATFTFIALFLNWLHALDLFPVCAVFSCFCSCTFIYLFIYLLLWLPGSIYCTLLLIGQFWFCLRMYIYIRTYSVTTFMVTINLFLFAVLWCFPLFFHPSPIVLFLFSLIIFKTYYMIYIYSFVVLSYHFSTSS